MIKKKQLLAVVCVVHFLLGLDINIISVSLPSIAEHFNINSAEASRVVWIYFLVLTGSLLGFGKLGDHFGFKNIYVLGIFIFTAATVLIGFSLNFTHLLIFRILQAAGASVMYALTPAIISEYFPNEFKGKAFGINYMFTALGGVTGRSISGFLINYFGWYSVFAIKIPFGIIALVLVIKYLPYVQNEEKKIRFDFSGAMLVFSGLLLFLYSINIVTDFGWLSLYVIVPLFTGLLLIAVFIIRESRIMFPLLNLKLLKNKQLSVYLISFLSIYIITNGMIFILPFFLRMFKNFTVSEIGLIMTVPSFAQIIFGYISGVISDKTKQNKIIIYGMIVTAASAVYLTFITQKTSVFDIVAILGFYGAAIGLMIPGNTNTVMKFSGVGDKGSLSSLMITSVRIGSALGVCFISTIFSAFVPEKNPVNTNLDISVIEKGFDYAFYFMAAAAVTAVIINAASLRFDSRLKI